MFRCPSGRPNAPQGVPGCPHHPLALAPEGVQGVPLSLSLAHVCLVFLSLCLAHVYCVPTLPSMHGMGPAMRVIGPTPRGACHVLHKDVELGLVLGGDEECKGLHDEECIPRLFKAEEHALSSCNPDMSCHVMSCLAATLT